MPTPIVDRSVIDQLNAYPMLVTCQIVVETADQPATPKPATTTRHSHRSFFARLHHTSRFGRPR